MPFGRRAAPPSFGVRFDAGRYAVGFFALDGQHLSGHRPAVGHEFLDAPDRQDGRRLGIYLRGAPGAGIQTDPPALAVDQRLRPVLAHARARGGQIRRGVARQLVFTPVRSGQTLLL